MDSNLYHLTPEQRASGIVALPETLGEAIDEFAGSELMGSGLRRPHLRQLREAEAEGVGRVPDPADAVGARPLPGGSLDSGHFSAYSSRRVAAQGERCTSTDGRSRAPHGARGRLHGAVGARRRRGARIVALVEIRKRGRARPRSRARLAGAGEAILLRSDALVLGGSWDVGAARTPHSNGSRRLSRSAQPPARGPAPDLWTVRVRLSLRPAAEPVLHASDSRSGAGALR